MTVMRKLAAGMLVAVGLAGLAAIGTAQASTGPATGFWAEGWASPGCVPVSVVKYSDGSVWGVEDCGGLERRILLGHA